jgi:hypothetical protein
MTETQSGAGTPEAPENLHPAHRYDPAARRKAKPGSRGERGIWLYIPRDELLRLGAPIDGSPVYYRVWGTERGGAFLRFYNEQ